MERFSIVALRIFDGCEKKFKKVLKQEWYLFSQKYQITENEPTKNKNYKLPANFFTENINIQAIVGKNGCGKSSLVEIMLRILNNLAVKLSSKSNNELYPVSGIDAALYFEIDDKLSFIECRNNEVFLNIDGEYIIAGKNIIDTDTPTNNPSLADILPLKKALPILRRLFFTIVNNYSSHSYNTCDFQTECGAPDRVWIDGLFHKNDGYLTPIVLNPFRSNGILDMKRETYLTKTRLASLFYQYAEEGENFIDDYQFKSLTFTLQENRVLEKLQYHPRARGKISHKVKIKQLSMQTARRNFFNITLKHYFGGHRLNNRIAFAYKYLVAKTFSISEKYPNYKNNIKVGVIDLSKYCNAEQEARIKRLVDKIKRDPSHTTLKIRQTLKYIEYVNTRHPDNYRELTEKYIEYEPADPKILEGLTEEEKLVARFPPSFFDIEIGLRKKEDPDVDHRENNPGNAEGDTISFERMSSGERQFLFYMSTILYHLRNLNSVIDGDESVHYNYVNIILKEVELYFHPEYQRKFISKLIKYLNAKRYRNIKYFNVMIVTHSPFVLSDIPKDNILFLKQGRQVVRDDVNFDTLGANIHDLLRYNFFLEEGLMGEWAIEQIRKVTKWLTSAPQEKERWKEQEILYVINSIGEPIIKDRLLGMYYEKWPDEQIIIEKINKLQEQLDQIKR